LVALLGMKFSWPLAPLLAVVAFLYRKFIMQKTNARFKKRTSDNAKSKIMDMGILKIT
jgi:hypothetical protein